MVRFALGLAALCLAVGCSSQSMVDSGSLYTGDPRCGIESCITFVDQCGLAFGSEPSGAVFLACSNMFTVPADFDSIEYCPAACNAQPGGGAVVACLSADPRCGGSDDGGQQAAVDACTPSMDAGCTACDVDGGCRAQCDSDRATCENTCPSKSSFDACMQCGAACGLTWGSCGQVCYH